MLCPRGKGLERNGEYNLPSLVIPAAGLGSRMGNGSKPKALTPFRSGTLISHVINQAPEFVDEIVIVISPAAEKSFIDSFASEDLTTGTRDRIKFAFQTNPTGSLDAVKLGLQFVTQNRCVIVWADQIGVTRKLIEAVFLQLNQGELSIPLLWKENPYVWLDADRSQVFEVFRSRDGDSPPSSGWTDLGCFGLGKQAREFLLSRELSDLDDSRELDFTYALPNISSKFPTSTFEWSDPLAAISVNSPSELVEAERLIT